MASPFLEKLQVAVVTATLVSAAWIVAGTILLDRDDVAVLTGGSSASGPVAVETQRATTAQGRTGPPAGAMQASLPPASQTDDLLIPVAGIAAGQLADTFDDERGGGTRLHEALDIMAASGTPVVAAAPGTVEKLFTSEAGGITVYVRSADRQTIYYYAHLRDYAPGLREGQQLARGARIGTVGATGNADPGAPHLHFQIMRTQPEAEWWEPAVSVNPYPLLAGR